MPFAYCVAGVWIEEIALWDTVRDFYERNKAMETDLFEFAYVPDWYGQLEELEGLVLPEPWKFKRPSVEMKNQDTPILERYIHTIFRKQSIDFNSAKDEAEAARYFHVENECACFHTGLYTGGIRQSMVFSTGIKGVLPCWTGISGGSAMRFHRG